MVSENKILRPSTYRRLTELIQRILPTIHRRDYLPPDTADPIQLNVVVEITGGPVPVVPPLVVVVDATLSGLQLDDGSFLTLDDDTTYLGLDGEGTVIVDPSTTAKYVYQANVVYRNLNLIGKDGEWQITGRYVWAYDINDGDLEVGVRYQGILDGSFNGAALVQVSLSSSAVAIIRVTGKPRSQDGRLWYPGIVSSVDPNTYARTDGAVVWELQTQDAELATTGTGFYMSEAKGFSYTICGETRRVYETDRIRRLLGGGCDPVTGDWKGVFEGPYEGIDSTPCPTTTTSTTTSTTTTTTTTP